jgi:small redox-active disulfide protein 2
MGIFSRNKRYDSCLIKKKGGYEMEIRILGPGCPRCGEVEKRTINALAELNVGANVQKITDIKKISEYRVFATPGLVINGKVKSSGRIPSLKEIKIWIQEEM